MKSSAGGILKGVFAALVTPRDDRGRADLDRLNEIIDFVLARGVSGICLGGATSEYPHFDLSERKDLIRAAACHLKGRARLLVAIGSSSIEGVLELGREAVEAGGDALVLPMPHFYRYAQSDLEHFARQVARKLDFPCILYNLPATTNLLTVETILRLLESEDNLVALKDSSGDLAAQVTLAANRPRSGCALLVGADEVFFPALEKGWDGIISGIASFCPELPASVFRQYHAGELEAARRSYQSLLELIQRVDALPFPWGIRVGQEVRGIRTGPLAIPPSPERELQIQELKGWLEQWLEATCGYAPVPSRMLNRGRG